MNVFVFVKPNHNFELSFNIIDFCKKGSDLFAPSYYKN